MALVKRVQVQSDTTCLKCKTVIPVGGIAIKDRSIKYDITPAVKVRRKAANPGCQGVMVTEIVQPKKIVRHPERPTSYYCPECINQRKLSKRPGKRS